MGDDFILPDAPDHVYTEEEPSELTPEELRIARNEIYARHGRTFKSDDLNQYFTGKPWYNGTIDPEQFDEEILNPSERANRDRIRQMESAHGVCSAPRIGTEDVPVINRSTATLPISQTLYRMCSGASVQEAEAAITHDKTTEAWMSLVREENRWAPQSDLVIAYEPSAQVLEELEKPGKEIIKKPIGRDALVFLCNRSTPVKSITSSQIKDIYAGNIHNWKEVGGKNRTIQAFQLPYDSGSQNLMEKLVMKGTTMTAAPADYLASEMGELIEYVSSYDDTGNALGYSVYYYARNMYRKSELTFMAIDGIAPESSTIRDGSYPFVNDFYAAIRADEPKDSKAYQLFEWLTGEDGQSLINALGYVGVGEGARELPGELTTAEEDFKAVIPLPENHVILADGYYLYGEAGICIFDSQMRLLQFIGHTDSSLTGTLAECKKDEVIPVQDTLTGKDGYYSIEKNQWVDMEEDPVTEDDLAVSFKDNHPELLEKYGTDASVDYTYYFSSSPPVMIIQSKGIEHYYDVYGNHLLDYNTEGKNAEELPNRTVLPMGSGMACLIIEWDTHMRHYSIYKNGCFFKELDPEEKGEIEEVYPHFYTKTRGNYLYIYNYQDQPCAKFLLGYYNKD